MNHCDAREGRLLLDTPLGRLRLRAAHTHLLECRFDDLLRPFPPDGGARSALLDRAADAVARYLVRPRSPLRVPLAPPPHRGALLLRQALARVPAGEVIEMPGLLRILDEPDRSAPLLRRAIVDNPLELFVPTHRILGPGAGLRRGSAAAQRRQWELLRHEGALPLPRLPRGTT